MPFIRYTQSVLIAKLISFLKETVVEAFKVATSKEGLKGLYGVSLYRNAVYLMLKFVIGAATGFAFWIIATRLYATKDVGLSSATIAAASLLALLSTLGLDYRLVRFLPGSGEKARHMINFCFTISGLLSIVLSLIFLAGLGIWVPALVPIREHPLIFIAFVVFTAASTISALVSRSFVAKQRAEFSLAQGLIANVLKFIPLVVFATLFRTFGIFASWGLSIVAAVAIGVFLFLPRVQAGYHLSPSLRKKVINKMADFSSLNYITVLLGSVPGLVLPLMVVKLLGAEANAYFYIGWTVANVLFMIPTAISFSLFAEGSCNEDKLGQEVRRSLKLILLILIPATLLVLLAGDKILLAFGRIYSENATRLLWILALAALPLSLNYIYFSIKRVQMKMKSVVGLTAFIAIATLGLTYVLLPRLGILGAGISWLTAQSVVGVVTIGALFRGLPRLRVGREGGDEGKGKG